MIKTDIDKNNIIRVLKVPLSPEKSVELCSDMFGVDGLDIGFSLDSKGYIGTTSSTSQIKILVNSVGVKNYKNKFITHILTEFKVHFEKRIEEINKRLEELKDGE